MSEDSQPSETSSLNLDFIDADIQRCQDFLNRNELSMQQTNQILQKSNMISQKNHHTDQNNMLTSPSNKNTTKNVLNVKGNSREQNKITEKKTLSVSTARQAVQNKNTFKQNLNGTLKQRPQSAGPSTQPTHTNIKEQNGTQVTQHALSINDPQFLLRSQNLQQKIQEEYENLPGSQTVQRRQSDIIQKAASQAQAQMNLDQQSFQPILDNEQQEDNNDFSIQQIQNEQHKQLYPGQSQFDSRFTLQQGQKLTDFAKNGLRRKSDDKYAFGSRIDQNNDQMRRSRPEPTKSRRMQEIEEQQRNKELQENTGVPKINDQYNAEHQIKSRYNQIDYKQVMEKREHERAMREKKNMEDHPFAPNIQNSAPLSKSLYSGNKLMSFEERQRVYNEKAQEKKEKIQQERENDLKKQSTPKTSTSSQIYNRYQDKNFLERLQIYDEERRDKLNRLKNEADSAFAKDQILSCGPSSSDKLPSNIGGTFEKRQEYYNKKRNTMMSELTQKYDKCWNIQKTIKSDETIQDACDRLYRHKRRQQRESEMPKECTFKPEIDVQSTLMARNKPNLQEHAIEIQREIQRKKDLEYERKQEEELAKLTFKPQLSELSKAVMPHFRFDDTKNLMAQIKTEKEFKERKQQDQKRELEMRSLAQNQELVTKTKKGAIDHKIFGPVQVHGMEKVRERQERIKQQKEELKQRELAVFGAFCQPFNEQEDVEKQKKPQKVAPTIVEPFELTKRLERSARKEKLYVSRDEYRDAHRWHGPPAEEFPASTGDGSRLLYQTGASRAQATRPDARNLVEAMMRVEL